MIIDISVAGNASSELSKIDAQTIKNDNSAQGLKRSFLALNHSITATSQVASNSASNLNSLSTSNAKLDTQVKNLVQNVNVQTQSTLSSAKASTKATTAIGAETQALIKNTANTKASRGESVEYLFSTERNTKATEKHTSILRENAKAKTTDNSTARLISQIKALNETLSVNASKLKKQSRQLSKLSASNKSLQNTIGDLSKEYDDLHDEMKKVNKQTRNSTDDMKKLIAEYLTFSLAIASMKSSFSAFVDLEEKTLEIAKTTGLAGDKLKEFTKILDETSQSVRGMKLDSLYEISAIAGQLGIKGKADLLEFTLEIQKIAKTSKLTAEQAGEGFAQLSNSLQEPIKNISKLTSVFTALASSTTASEVDLLDYSQRLAGAGKTLELTTAQIVGIGATLKDVGITAEVGGTAISQVFMKIITDGEKMAKRVGIDTAYFAKSIKEKPVDAVLALLEAIGKLDKEAKVKALKDLQLSGSGLSSTILKLSTNTDKLRANILTANEAYRAGTATQEEFDIAVKGVATTVEQFQDKIKLASAAIASEFIPNVEFTIEVISSLIDKIKDNQKEFLFLVKTIGTLIIAWKTLNIVMKSSPFGRVVAGLTAVISAAILAKKAIENVFETEQRRAKLAVAYGKRINSTEFKDDTRKDAYKVLIAKEKLYQDSISATQKTLANNKALGEDQRKVIQNNLETQKETLANLTMQRVELEKYYPLLVKNASVIAKVAPKTSTPKTTSPKIFVTPIVTGVKKQLKGIRTVSRAKRLAFNKSIREKEREQKRIVAENLRNEKASIRELARLEETRLDAVASFDKDFRQTTIPKLQFSLEELGKQRKEWLKIGIDSVKVQELYNAKAKEIVKEDIKARAKEAKDKLEQLKLERKKTEELKKQNNELGKFVNALSETLQSSLLTILDDFSKSGNMTEAVINFTQSGQIQDTLMNSGNAYATAIGAVGKLLSGALSSEIKLDLNVGEHNKSVERSLRQLEELQNPQNKFLEEIQDNTKNMVVGFAQIAKGLTGVKGADGANFSESFEVNNTISSIVDGLSLGILSNDLVSAISGAFYSSTTELKNSGIRFADTTVAELDKIKAQSFQLIKRTKSYLFGVVKSSSDSLRLTDNVPKSVTDMVASSIQNGVQNILLASAKLGIANAEEVANSIQIRIGDLDLKGKSEEEINTLIQGVLGNQIDNIARIVAGGAIESFRAVGEDYYSSVIRVATQFADAQQTLKDANIKAIGSIQEISDKTANVYAEVIRESLIKMQIASSRVISSITIELPIIGTKTFDDVENTLTGIGGIIETFRGTGNEILSLYQSLIATQQRLREISNTANAEVTKDLVSAFGSASEMSSLQDSFYQSFVSDADKLVDLKNRLTTDLGFVPDTKEQYLELVKQIDLTTQSGRERYALLIKESESFSDMIDVQKRISDQAKDSAKDVKKAWDETYANVQKSLTNTIKQILNIGRESNTQSSLVQDIIDYNQMKRELKSELGKQNPDSEKITSLTTQLSSTSLSIGENERFDNQTFLANDLRTLRDSLPTKRIQKVEVVNSTDTETLNKMLTSMYTDNNQNAKMNKLLLGILEELEVQGAKA